MKLSLIRTATLFTASASCVLLSSCDVTGNPREGGIFWSENKAQKRLDDRQQKLEDVEHRTHSTQRKSAQTQRQIDNLR